MEAFFWENKGFLSFEISGHAGDKIAYLVADTAKFGHNLFVGADDKGWVLELIVNHFGLFGIQRAMLAGIVANGNDIIEFQHCILVLMVGGVAGNIHPRLGHHGNGAFIDFMRVDPGGKGLNAIRL